ncbi:MAG TPA: hypothetical protein ACFCUD_03980 [Cyclobacteriaceae bacterium]
MIKHKIALILLFFLSAIYSWGQRIEIDRLERDFRGSFKDREAYELSQKFLQIDSTYYTGHYFEGLYRYFRASDKLGYQQAIKPIKKSIYYLEKDFYRQLRRSTNLSVYINTYQYQRKYAVLIDLLEKCYQYTAQPEKAIETVRKLIKKDFVFNFGVQPYATLSWIYHRNRTYSPEKYPFLKSTIMDNVLTASKYADSILITNRKNKRYVSQWFSNYADGPEGSYYHFKDIIYSYLLKVDSAEYCASQLERLNRLSKNNYGNLQFIQANYKKAERYYDMARNEDGYRYKSTKEFDYMQSVIKIFSNELEEARNIVANSIDLLGPTPGFGWNNIAMARANYYSGDLEATREYASKASEFKEVHINSTWGKLQYDRNTLLFEYLYHKQKINEIKFLNTGYWYDLSDLKDLVYHYFKKENAHLILTSDLSANPERFLVLYNIFSSENTLFFDEIWEVIKNFNADYFIDLFTEKRAKDRRPGIIKYYDYYIAKFHLEDGNYDLAVSSFQNILEDPTLEPEYEKLLLGRVYEGLAIAFERLDMSEESNNFKLKFYETYPQIVPFSSLNMDFNLVIENKSLSDGQEKIVDKIKNSAVNWSSSLNNDWPTLYLQFVNGTDEINYTVEANAQKKFEGKLVFEENDSRFKQLLYKAFGITLESNRNLNQS